MLSFSKWLGHQKTRTDAVGEFARSDYAKDTHATKKTVMVSLMAKSAPASAFEAVHAAFNEYDRVLKASGHTPKAKKAPAAAA